MSSPAQNSGSVSWTGDSYGGRFIEPAPADLAEGMIEHEARVAIRDLIRINGFEKAREQVAFMLMDEADRSSGR